MGFVPETSASRRRVDLLLKVTRAFSELQERFVALKRERMVDELRGMLKFVWPADSRRGILLPRVAFLYGWPGSAVELTLMVVQPMSAALSQWAPVNPLAHTQRQASPATMLVPPLAQM